MCVCVFGCVLMCGGACEFVYEYEFCYSGFNPKDSPR